MSGLLLLVTLISLVFLIFVIFGFVLKLHNSGLSYIDVPDDTWFSFAAHILKWLLLISVSGLLLYMIISLSFTPEINVILAKRLLTFAIGFVCTAIVLLLSALLSFFEFAVFLGIINSVMGKPRESSNENNRSTSVFSAHKKRREYSNITRVDFMNPLRFEKFCAELLKYNGYHGVELTPKTGDQGVDITATKGNTRYAFQCKHYKANVGNKAVQEVYTGKTYYGCSVGVVITNSHFTPKAKEIARTTHTVLWGRDKLQELMKCAAKAKYP